MYNRMAKNRYKLLDFMYYLYFVINRPSVQV